MKRKIREIVGPIIEILNHKRVKVFITLILVLLAVALVLAVVNRANTPEVIEASVGNTFTREGNSYVYVGASSEVYKEFNSSSAECKIIDIFDKISDVDLASAIDKGQFPVAVEYVACSNNGSAYMIEITNTDGSSQIYWVKP